MGSLVKNLTDNHLISRIRKLVNPVRVLFNENDKLFSFLLITLS